MKVILLEIPIDRSELSKADSYINNFLDKNYFYFHIPDDLPKTDQTHLERIAKSFFKLQINPPIENFLSIKEIDLSEELQINGKEIPWEIFFKFDHLITVNSNVFDDNLDWVISGFKGKIINFFSGDDQDIYQIQFSAESLSKIPISKLKQISKMGSPFYTYLEPEYIMPEISKSNSTQDQTDLVKLAIKIFDHIELPEDVFSMITDANSFLEIVQKWEDLFKKYAHENQAIEVYLSNQDKYKLVEICESDEFFGLWGNFIKDDIHYLFPMTEIKKVINHRSFNSLLQSYKKIMKIILPN